MPLTKCPDCDRELSTAAPACPHCGRPMPAVAAPLSPPMLIEQTAKKWKKRKLFALGFIGLSFVCCTVAAVIPSASTRPEDPVSNGEIAAAASSGILLTLGTGLFLLGVAVYVAAHFGAWWNHK